MKLMKKFLLALLEGIQESKRYRAERHTKGYRP
jgi:hypothetical protein